MDAREGDYLEDSEGSLFGVKGLTHPQDRIIAFIRYFPDKTGKRRKNSRCYKKVYSLSKRYVLLKRRYPQYLVYDPIFDEKLCEVSIAAVEKRYTPSEKLRKLRNASRLDIVENLALKLAQHIKVAIGIPWDTIGISGSIMLGLHLQSSDIDPIVYGSENCRKVYSGLKELLSEEHGPFKPYTSNDLNILFDFRSKDTIMDYKDFVRTESRKVLQGKFLQRDYFIRFVKDWSEINERYGDVQYMNVGYARVKATVVDDSASIFTPCTYKISDVLTIEGQQKRPLKEITSFRGRFCEQAREGEVIIAQGKVERVKHLKENTEYFRLLLGNKPSDFMILA